MVKIEKKKKKNLNSRVLSTGRSPAVLVPAQTKNNTNNLKTHFGFVASLVFDVSSTFCLNKIQKSSLQSTQRSKRSEIALNVVFLILKQPNKLFNFKLKFMNIFFFVCVRCCLFVRKVHLDFYQWGVENLLSNPISDLWNQI